MSSSWDHSAVPGLYGRCQPGACQLEAARAMMARAQAMLDTAERLAGRTADGQVIMSQSLWCDEGNHAFSARDPKAEHWERHVKNDEGEPVVIPWDVCGPCLAGSRGKSAPPAAVSLSAGSVSND